MLYPCQLIKYEKFFHSAIQLFAYEKAMENANVALRKAILASKKPINAAKLCSMVEKTSNWFNRRDSVMVDVLNLKTEQVPEVLTYMESCKGNNFVCIDEFDRYWGCGESLKVAELMNANQYPGQNKLGEIWTEISNTYFPIH